MLIRLLLFVLVPISAFAASVDVQQVADGARIEQLLNTAVSRATTELEGRGTTLSLTYSSPEDLSVIILFTSTTGLFDPLDSLVVTLPAGARKKADINLTHSSGWTPFTQMYRLHFISTSSEGATFEKVEFTGTSLSDVLSAGFLQLISPLPFTPSSYHRLRAYNVFGFNVISILGAVLILLVVILVLRKKYPTAISTVIVLTLLVNARFTLDALWYATAHASEYLTYKTYATAGDLPAVIDDLKHYQVFGVTLCHTGTSYAERFLTYHVYPLPVNTELATHIVVYKSMDWSYENGVLHCGNDSYDAQLLHTYAEGTQLYSIMHP